MIVNDFNVVRVDSWTGIAAKTREDAEKKALKIRQRPGMDGVLMTAAELKATPLYASTVLAKRREAKRQEILSTVPAGFVELVQLVEPSALTPTGKVLAATLNQRLDDLKTAGESEIDAI